MSPWILPTSKVSAIKVIEQRGERCPLIEVRYGMLTLTGNIRRNVKGTRTEYQYETTCDCGTLKWVRKGNLKSGVTNSCGCTRGVKRLEGLTEVPPRSDGLGLLSFRKK